MRVHRRQFEPSVGVRRSITIAGMAETCTFHTTQEAERIEIEDLDA